MDSWQRRFAGYVSGLLVLMIAFAVAYEAGVEAFEGRERTLLESMRFVTETFTTTGFGSEAPWDSAVMQLFIIVMDLVGVVVIFLALPVLLVPLLEEALSTTVPTRLEDDREDHVVLCAFSPRGETLVAELEAGDAGYVVVEPDRDRAEELLEEGYDVIHADPQSVDGLQAARLSDARALVADAADEINTSVILTADEVDEDVRTISVVAEPDRAKYHELAGADVVISPRELLGESLAGKVTTSVSTEVGDAVEIGEDFEIAELPIHRGSDLVGRTLADSGIRERAGVNVIGAWFRGQFESPPSPDAVLDEGTVLLVTGEERDLERLKELTLSDARRFARGETLVVGYGEVGRTAAADLAEADVPFRVFDREEKPGVDVVGDATEPEDLRRAGVEDAHTVVLALSDDTSAEFATLVIRDLNPDVEVVARAEQSENVRKMYRAGADYVLSLATVTGRMLASTILADEEVIAADTQVEVVRTRAPGLVGRRLDESDVRARTGCTVVAVERDGDVITDVGPEVTVREGDDLVVAGTDEGVNRFAETFE